MHTYIHTYVCCIYTYHMYICIHMLLKRHLYIYIHTHICITYVLYIYTHTYMYYICVCVCVCVCMYIYRWIDIKRQCSIVCLA